MDNKEMFKELVSKYINRKGIEQLMEGLEKSDFFQAPASTRYHSSEEGGLVKHSIIVFNQLTKIPDVIENYSMETIAIVALFHDLCKIGYYKTEMRNTKVDGKWVQVPYYTVEDLLPFGHGEKSVYLISEHLKLTLEEAMAIRWHMGGFVPKEEYGTLGEAFKQFPLALHLHMADMRATYLIEK